MGTQSLTFRDVSTTVPRSWRSKARVDVVRELFVDDLPMTLLLAGAGRVYLDGVVALPVLPSDVNFSVVRLAVPLQARVPLEDRLSFLNSLLGVPWSEFDGLALGRVPLALCRFDFDPECGFSTAQLGYEDDVVRWDHIGEELDDWSRDDKSESNKQPVQEWKGWIPWLYSPPVAFAFNRTKYERAIREEIRFQSSLG